MRPRSDAEETLMTSLPYAEEINYWRTSKSSPDVWLARTRVLIAKAGGKVLAEGYGSEPQTGRGLVMIAFDLAGDRFKIV